MVWESIEIGKRQKVAIPARDLLRELTRIGIFSEYRRRKSDPIRYSVPEIYLHGLGLSRKGRI